jgi:broad specificity phosphatase PhoE
MFRPARRLEIRKRSRPCPQRASWLFGPGATAVPWSVVRLILVRHADAYAGFEGVISGQRGCKGLTPLGRRQADALRRYLADSGRVRADVLLASVLPRAIETAQIISSGLGLPAVRQECDLCEIHTGDADGLEWTEYAARYGSFDMEAEPERVFAPGGESWTTFHERVQRMFARIAQEFTNQTVVAVCHAGVITASMRVLFRIPHPGTGARIRPTNTGLTEWEHEQAFERWTLRSFNERPHLLGIKSQG